MLSRPQTGEYGEHFETYIQKVPEGDLLAFLERQPKLLRETWAGVSEEQANYRYAEGKWSVKEVLGHIADTERVMQYRLLRIARGDTTPLPGFDEELFARHATFDRQSIEELLHGFEVVREGVGSAVGRCRMGPQGHRLRWAGFCPRLRLHSRGAC